MNEVLTNSALAVIEEIMERALHEAQEARRTGRRDRLMAFVEVLGWAKQQAAVMDLPSFANDSLNRLEPEALLAQKREAA